MNRPPTALEASRPLHLPGLAAYRAAAAQRLAEAACDVPDVVCGQRVRPLTPASFSMLAATRSPFVSGGRPRESDVRDYLWFHSPLWCPFGARFFRLRKWHALRRFNHRMGRTWLRHLRRPFDRTIVLALAVDEIETLVDQAFACAPGGGGKGRAPLATLEAHLIHAFASAYGWLPERTRHTPLRLLLQLDRCLRLARGETVRDSTEEAMLFAHLQARNAELAAARAAAPEAASLA